MTLDQLRQELQQLGVRQVGAMRRHSPAEGRESVTLVFSADLKIVVPLALKTVYFLQLDSDDSSTIVHSEKYNCLMRAIERDRDNGYLPAQISK